MKSELLARGSEGQLWLKDQVVIKKISDPSLIKFFTPQELARRSGLWMQLEQNGFCAPYAVIKTSDRLAFKSRFVAGTCLRDFNAEPMQRLKAVLAGTIEVHRLHNLGVLHGDISPGNLLTCGTWIDWTSADYMGRSFFRGTFDHIAPEFKQAGIYTKLSEIYSLGALAAYALGTKSPGFIHKAMQALPHLRFVSAQSLALAMQQYLDDSAG
jgi:serine/threonine protein kinase